MKWNGAGGTRLLREGEQNLRSHRHCRGLGCSPAHRVSVAQWNELYIYHLTIFKNIDKQYDKVAFI